MSGVAIRGLHLDLKGVPPTFERLLSLLKVIKAAGYNAVLVEWEDMFPWTVDVRFRCETVYTPQQIRQFAAVAAQEELELIPLVQCLGHMETFLTPSGYEHLREVPHWCNVLNPLALGARELVERLMEDVVAQMPTLRYLHLGGDEASTLGTHADTRAYIEKHGQGTLYLHHVGPLLDKLLARNIRPILWHDMMRTWDDQSIRRLGERADLMVWGYGGHPDTTRGPHKTEHIQRFAALRVSMWGATAYKGADGHDRDLPDPAARQLNAEGWVDVANRFNMKGVVATAWSRYTTGMVQNEPIDGCLDTLLLVGAILRDGKAPEGRIESLLPMLDALCERERFNSCRTVLARLTEGRNGAWGAVRSVRQQLTMLRMDGRRRGGDEEIKMLAQLRHHVAKLDEAAEQMRRVFAGLMDRIWIDRYLAERIEPLRDELAQLDSSMRQFNAAGHAAS